MQHKTLIIALLALLSLKATSQEINLNWIDREAESKSKSLTQQYKALTSKVGNEYDLTYIRLLLEVDPAENYITGSITSYFKILKEPPHTLTFDMHDSLNVNIIRYHGEALENWTHENDVLTINLPDAQAYGTIDSIMVDYEGAPVDGGLGSFSTDLHDGVPVLATLSQPYGAKDWWPCKQNLNDKIDSVLIVATCPQGYLTASNGILDSICNCNGKVTMCWKHNHPIPAYLIAIAVTNYAQYSDYAPLSNGDSIEILNYVYPEEMDDIQAKTP